MTSKYRVSKATSNEGKSFSVNNHGRCLCVKSGLPSMSKAITGSKVGGSSELLGPDTSHFFAPTFKVANYSLEKQSRASGAFLLEL